VEVFYGVKLDTSDPYLKRNLSRLEIRFRKRLEASRQKDSKRQASGKDSHPTTLKSIKENKDRLEKVLDLKERFF